MKDLKSSFLCNGIWTHSRHSRLQPPTAFLSMMHPLWNIQHKARWPCTRYTLTAESQNYNQKELVCTDVSASSSVPSFTCLGCSEPSMLLLQHLAYQSLSLWLCPTTNLRYQMIQRRNTIYLMWGSLRMQTNRLALLSQAAPMVLANKARGAAAVSMTSFSNRVF